MNSSPVIGGNIDHLVVVLDQPARLDLRLTGGRRRHARGGRSWRAPAVIASRRSSNGRSAAVASVLRREVADQLLQLANPALKFLSVVVLPLYHDSAAWYRCVLALDLACLAIVARLSTVTSQSGSARPVSIRIINCFTKDPLTSFDGMKRKRECL